MIHDWPAELPRPERDSWQVQRQDARRKRAPEVGAPGYRRRFSGVGQSVTLSLLLSRAQREVFDHFWTVDCAEGTGLFRMPDPTTDGWPVLASDGTPLLGPGGAPVLMSRLWLCAWGDAPPVQTIFGQVEFRLSFSVVVIP